MPQDGFQIWSLDKINWVFLVFLLMFLFLANKWICRLTAKVCNINLHLRTFFWSNFLQYWKKENLSFFLYLISIFLSKLLALSKISSWKIRNFTSNKKMYASALMCKESEIVITRNVQWEEIFHIKKRKMRRMRIKACDNP